LEYSLAQAGDVEVDLFDVAGRHVAKIEEGARSAGRHSLRKISGFTPGVYFIGIRVGRDLVTRKVVLPLR
jgi:hypothetical protein